ncbi:hypothetical protein [Streptomyces palmae]|uniref:Uncharacterized protein n=1 Tax=Streptomyces palmae TaxID=1701085 RepID=A0A4Z0H7K6_9ACTN|nr:hypothetical protein [Streptomyces palmae]TGB06933.1 hypothetical protein E4099_17780 [Streptomyces palmae]
MTEPTRYSTAPVELPLQPDLEPTPVEGCAGCAELAAVRDCARAGGDSVTVAECNARLRRHPEGH